jgi:hypothetical protein
MPTGVYPRLSAPDRFWMKVQKTHTCWLWLGAKDERGYGRFAPTSNKAIGAHCFSYILNVGPIPAEKPWILHHCDNPSCVRPDHLFSGTAADNALDCKTKGRNTAGSRHPWHLRPELVRRGDNHPWRKRPELVRRGIANHAARLTDALVQYARSQVAAGRSQRSVALELGVNPMTISRAIRGTSWSHIV